jgi:hypothetical protein
MQETFLKVDSISFENVAKFVYFGMAIRDQIESTKKLRAD